MKSTVNKICTILNHLIIWRNQSETISAGNFYHAFLISGKTFSSIFFIIGMQGQADLEFHLPVKEFTKLVYIELTINKNMEWV